MRKLIPIKVEKKSICHDRFCLDGKNGLIDTGAVITDNESVYAVEFVPTSYNILFKGEVFIPLDEDGCYPMEEPSCYLMKMGNKSNWYLTGDSDSPLGIDQNEYDQVWMVK